MANLVEAVHRAVPGFGDTVRAALQDVADVRGELRRLMALFLDELHRLEPDQICLILDGLHHITDGAIIEALEEGLRAPSSPLRLLVATQTDPRLYLSVLRSQGLLVEIRTEDFLWTPEELRRLTIPRVGRPIPQGALDDLMRATGGWPSAANLASLILARDLSSQSFVRLAPTEHGYGVLLRELLSGYPAEAREGLLLTSLLTWLDPASCRDGVGIENPEAFLRFVEGSGLPFTKPVGSDLPLGHEPLLRAALQQELARQLLPRELRALQHRVASYYATVGQWDEAIPGYLRLGEHEAAASLLERVLEEETPPRALDLYLRWVRTLPAAVRERHPNLMVREAGLLLSRGRVDEARVLLVATRAGQEASGNGRVRGEGASCWAAIYLSEGRYGAALDAAREALDQLPEEDSGRRAGAFWLGARALEHLGDLPGAFSWAAGGFLEAERGGRGPEVVRALMQLGGLAYLRGDCVQTLALTARAVQRAALSRAGIVPLSRIGDVVSSAYLERGQLQEAMAVARTALGAAETLRDDLGRLRARSVLAGIQEMMGSGEPEGALEGMVNEALKLVNRGPDVTMVIQRAASILLRRGRRKQGMVQGQRALELANACSHRPLTDQGRFIVAAAGLAGPGIVAGLPAIRRLIDAFGRGDGTRWLSAGHRLLALGYARLGLRWRARHHLRVSLALAAGQSFVGMPLGLPSSPDSLLLLATRAGIAHELAGTLLGVDVPHARKLLNPLLRHKDPLLRLRAEQALKGVEAGLGKAPAPRLAWPGASSEPTDPSQEVALHSLGNFLASTGGQSVEWPSVDARDLAAYLLVHRAVAVPRDRMVRDVWPDEDPAAANVRLQVALYRLREALGPGYPPVDPAMDSRGVYCWNGVACSLDVERFREMVGRAHAAFESENPPTLSESLVSLLEEAVALYHGEFLAGLGFRWCEEPREELRRSLLWATRLLIDHYMALNRWHDAIRHGLKSLGSDSLQEDVVRDLMVCYFRVGDRGAVERQYREVKRRLAREMGVWPSEETRRLRLRLLGIGAGWARAEAIEPSVLVVGK
jgi:DNA-binding SARP family transcriptional activator